MAKEYKCDRCGKPAVIHITRISGNEKLTLHFCEECAKKFALDNPNIPANLDPQIKAFEQKALKQVRRGVCPTCGATIGELKKGDKFSCPDCYSIMDDALLDMLEQMHGSYTHKGKTPKHHAPNVDISAAFAKRENFLSEDFLADLDNVVNSAIESVGDDIIKKIGDAAEKLSADSDGQDRPELPDLSDVSALLDAADAAKSAQGAGGASGSAGDKPAKVQAADSSNGEKTLEALQRELDEAIKQERYEDAAKIRDKINALPHSE